MLCLRTPRQVELLADRNCGLVRLLGLEMGTQESAGAKCQRYAAVVEDGVLLKLVSFAAVKIIPWEDKTQKGKWMIS